MPKSYLTVSATLLLFAGSLIDYSHATIIEGVGQNSTAQISVRRDPDDNASTLGHVLTLESHEGRNRKDNGVGSNKNLEGTSTKSVTSSKKDPTLASERSAFKPYVRPKQKDPLSIPGSFKNQNPYPY